MAQDFRVFLIDEFDWTYVNTSKMQVTQTLYSVGLAKVASAYSLLVLDCRGDPSPSLQKAKDLGAVWDQCYVQLLPDGRLTSWEPSDC